MRNIKGAIRDLARKYKTDLKEKIDQRIEEMETDDNSHYLIYKVLGIMTEEGKLIDIYQSKGRFLYKYAGSFLEEVAILCFEHKFQGTQKKLMITNTLGARPKQFEIDCLIGDRAYEIKWRDATTDGDHITKEHTRIKAIKDAGYIPVRIMFYYPNREQAIKVQRTLQTLYSGVGGEYYFGKEAWEYISAETGVDLYNILKLLANEVENE